MISIREQTRIAKITDVTVEAINSWGKKINLEESDGKHLKEKIIFKTTLQLDYKELVNVTYKTNNFNKMFSLLVSNSDDFCNKIKGNTILIDVFDDNEKNTIIDFDVYKSIEESLSNIKRSDVIGFRVTNYPIFKVLQLLNFKSRTDGRISIKLKNEPNKNECLINDNNYVISKEDEEDYYLLTPENISTIFDKFFKKNHENKINLTNLKENSSRSDDEVYKYSYVSDKKYSEFTGITETYTRYHKTKGGVERKRTDFILVIGQVLPNIISQFLENNGGFSKGYHIKENENNIFICQ